MTTARRHWLTEQAAEAAVDQACRMLHLPTIRAQFPELTETAAREQMSYRAFLAELLLADDRARRRSERRIKAAAFPGKSHCGPSTSTPTPTSTPPSSTASPPVTGSRRACRFA